MSTGDVETTSFSTGKVEKKLLKFGERNRLCCTSIHIAFPQEHMRVYCILAAKLRGFRHQST
jgi:hypothetical protein